MRDFTEASAPDDAQMALLGMVGEHTESLQQMASEFAQKVSQCIVFRNEMLS